MILVRLISWPYFRSHVLRTILTTAGIVLGVALFVGMRAANQTVLSAFSETIDRIAGKTQLQVTAGEAGFGEDVLERVQAASTVAVAVPIIEAIVGTDLPGGGNLLVLGVDMTGDRRLREYDFEEGDVVDDPLMFLAQPDSLILSTEFAQKHGLSSGSHIELGTAEGIKTFTVRGLMKSTGLASAFGGSLAVMDIYAAQKMFGRGRTFDRIDLAVKPGVTIAAGQQELRAMLGEGFEIQPPSGRGQQFASMLAGYRTMVSVSSAFALFIGMFIIYNAFAIAVTQRRREIGILRALGATRGQIRRLFLVESALVGTIGAGIGVAAGALIARAIAVAIGGLVTDIYRVEQAVSDVAMSPGFLSIAFVVGVATSVVAAAIPAFQASQVDPVHALQRGQYHALSAREGRARAVGAAVLGAFSVVCVVVDGPRVLFYAGYASAILATLLLGPLLVTVLVRAIRPVLRWIRPVEGALAADSLIQSPRRTSASVAALMLSLALVVGFEGMARANYGSIVDWTNTALNPDLFVLPSLSLDTRTTRFPASLAPEIAALPGVERVQMLRNVRVPFRDTQVMIVSLEMSSIAQTVKREPVAGDLAEMYRKSAAGEGLIVSDNLAQLQHLALGETLEVSAPYGLIRLPIVGILIDYSDQQGAILLDRSVFIKYWHDDSTNMFRVYVRPDATVATVRQQIQDNYAGHRQMFVLTNAEFKSYVLKIVGQWFGLTSLQIAVAVFVAILGIVNTLIVSITDRRRELAVLRAVGARHGEIRRTIWIEALTIGTLGLILGWALGAINLYYILQIVQRDITGMRLDYHFPFVTALTLVPIILGSAFLAAIWPAESAVRGSLVEALEYE